MDFHQNIRLFLELIAFPPISRIMSGQFMGTGLYNLDNMIISGKNQFGSLEAIPTHSEFKGTDHERIKK